MKKAIKKRMDGTETKGGSPKSKGNFHKRGGGGLVEISIPFFHANIQIKPEWFKTFVIK